MLIPERDEDLRTTAVRCPHCSGASTAGFRVCQLCGGEIGVPHAHGIAPARAHGARPRGQVIGGKYELLELVGEGGTSKVYRALHLDVGDVVAVKVLDPKYAGDEVLVERLRREALTARMLRDPHVVTILDFGTDKSSGLVYLVMEFIDGKTLREVLLEESALAPERAVALMLGMCAGVGAAHKRGIAHRDVKPENVMVVSADGEEAVVVLDFNIAKLLAPHVLRNLTQPGPIGTPLYISPEQCASDGRLDARTDVYSLSAILYEMLRGQPPFTGTSVVELIAQHLYQTPGPLPRHLNLSAEFEALIMRGLDKDPNGRPADAIEFARELKATGIYKIESPRRGKWERFLERLGSYFFA